MHEAKLCDLSGVGKARLKTLNEAGIFSIKDLLTTYPIKYQDTTNVTPLCNLKEGNFVCAEGTIKASPSIQYAKGGLVIVRASLTDGTATVPVIFFNQPWMMKNLKMGSRQTLYGAVQNYKGRIGLLNPESVHRKGIVPKYRALDGIGSKTFEKLIEQSLPYADELFSDALTDEIKSKFNLLPFTQAMREAHRPENAEKLAQAQRRLAFDDILYYQIAVLAIKTHKTPAAVINAGESVMAEFNNLLPFTLTKEQTKAVYDIAEDMAQGFSMNRILQGDVGSGKTAVALAAAYFAYKAGYQTAIMAPTETLAMQHIKTAKKIFEKSNVKCGLLLGHMKAREKREALKNIESGEWDIVIGTHALISEKVKYSRLGLVITDEQHRFGVRQRKRLSDKGESPHVLVLSATPIPRTLALALYGDLKVSTIRTSPPGRIPIKTGIVPENRRESMYEFIIESVKKGEQAYYICPLVEESDVSEAKSARDMYRRLSKGPLKSLRLGLTFGSQNQEEKAEAINDFSSGKTDVLVATTVVEVGIDVPNASIIVIEDADRFGLSQLHQLRGRVGRGSRQSWCFLLGKPNERLKALCETNDGFEIAKKDLELRGPGQFLGTMQHGKTNEQMFYDAELLEDAQKCAMEIMSDKTSFNQKIIDEAMRRFSYAASDIALN